MALHFLFGRAGTGKSTRVYEEIRDYVLSGEKRTAYLLVPDQGTYTAEYQLAKVFPGEGFANVTVCGFSRLAYRVFQELHSPVSDALSPLGQQVIIRRLLEEHKEELTMIGKAASHPHFSEELANFFHQLDMFCVSEKEMENAAKDQAGTPLGRKMADLSLLYKAYHQYLKDHFSYEGSLFDLLAREIPKSAALRNAKVWIDGFNGMAPQKIRIVSALIDTAREVTMTLQMDRPSDAVLNPNFARPYHLYTQLLQLSKKAESLTLTKPCRFESPSLAAMAIHFFDRRSEASPLPGENPNPLDGIHSITAPGKADEVDYISRTLLSLVRDHHLRFRDILVLTREPENYVDFFERSFDQYKIPGFIDREHPMNNHPLVMLLDSMVRFLTAESERKNAGWQRSRLFRVLKTFLLPEWPQESVDELENYVLSHNIRPWQYHEEWKFRDFRSLDSEAPALTEEEKESLKKANEWREKLLALFDPLAEEWKKKPLPKDRCALLYHWLTAEKIPRTLSEMDKVEAPHTSIRRHLQVWKKVLSLLEEIVHTAGNDPVKDEDFLTIFEDGLESLTYSTIPPTLDHVTVTGMDRGYAMEAKIVFVAGTLEGLFPKRMEEGGFFTELERQKIFDESHLIFGTNLLQKVQQEQFFAYLALTRARNALYLTRPAVNEEQGSAEPSFLTSQLERLGYASEIRTLSPEEREKDPSFFANPEEALSLLPLVLREKIPAPDSPWAALASWARENGEAEKLKDKLESFSYENKAAPLPRDLAAKLFKPGGRFLGSVTRFETYRKCPYSYYLSYGLHIDERDEGNMETLDYGNYLHAGLHLFGKELGKRKKQWRDATDEDISTLSETIAEKMVPKVHYGALHSDGASRYTERVLNETFRRSLSALRKWSRNSTFDTKALEKEFYLRIQGETDSFTLTGKIDRLDENEKGCAIFDYKTGHPTISIQEAAAGLKLQLLTYLLVVKEQEKDSLLPTALMYIYLSGDVKNVSTVPPGGQVSPDPENNGAGWIIDDSELVKELDSAIGTEDAFLKAKLKNDGSFYKTNAILSREDFENLLVIVKKKLLELYHRMEDGDISIRPVSFKGQSPCSYCPFHAICRFDPKGKGEGYEYIHMPSDTKLKPELAELAGKEEENGLDK